MSRRTLGLLASVIGSAIGAWWVMNRRRTRTVAGLRTADDHGVVIFSNTPSATNVDAIP